MARSSARSVETERILAARRELREALHAAGKKAQQKRRRWWLNPWVCRLAMLCLGAGVGALCVQAPEWAQPACVAVAHTLHAAGLP